jgi:SAM-dependent methyltransferase
MEETNCNLCGANDTELVYEEKDRLMKLPGTFYLVRCRQCGLLYLNPRPTAKEIGYYYPEEYGPYTVKPQDEPSWINRLDTSYGYWKRARLVSTAHVDSGRILDVGCATGNFLNMMSHFGAWELYGVDINAAGVQYARDRYGINACLGELADGRYKDGFFDVVTMWDVMEHVHDPTATLAEVHRILKPGGLFLVRVPNVATWDAKLFGRFWAGYDAPRHLYIYSPPTLTRFLDNAGFHIHRMRSDILGYAPFALSVQFWLDEKLREGPLKKALLAFNRSRVPRLLTRPLFFLLSYFNVTFAMTVLAIKGGVVQGQ